MKYNIVSGDYNGYEVDEFDSAGAALIHLLKLRQGSEPPDTWIIQGEQISEEELERLSRLSAGTEGCEYSG